MQLLCILNAGFIIILTLQLFTSCGDEELSNQDIINGRWEIMQLDGIDVCKDSDSSGCPYQDWFDFQPSGKFQYCSVNYLESNRLYCTSGEWNFQNTDQTEITLEHHDSAASAYQWYFTIATISVDRMEGEITITNGGAPPLWENKVSYEIVLEKGVALLINQ